MKIYQSFRYQLWEQRMAVLIYYGVMTAMVLLSLLAIPFISSEGGDFISTNGITAVTCVFAFILSLCAFKDSFLMNLQHGISRRSQFLGRLCALGALCGVMAVADEIYTLLLTGLQRLFPEIFHGSSLYEMSYCSTPTADGFMVETTPVTVLLSVVFSFFLLLVMCSLGYLITVLMYRMNKWGKILFWAGIPILFILLCSFISSHAALEAKVCAFIVEAASLCFSSLPRVIVTCTLLTALFSGFTWLLMRRAPVK